MYNLDLNTIQNYLIFKLTFVEIYHGSVSLDTCHHRTLHGNTQIAYMTSNPKDHQYTQNIVSVI